MGRPVYIDGANSLCGCQPQFPFFFPFSLFPLIFFYSTYHSHSRMVFLRRTLRGNAVHKCLTGLALALTRRRPYYQKTHYRLEIALEVKRLGNTHAIPISCPTPLD